MCSSHETDLSTRQHPAHPVPALILHPWRDTSVVVTKLRRLSGTYVVRSGTRQYAGDYSQGEMAGPKGFFFDSSHKYVQSHLGLL